VSFERAKVEAIEQSDGALTGVRLDDDRSVACGTAILAAGAASSTIGGLSAAKLPKVRPVKGQLVHLRAPTPLIHGNVRGIDAYLVGRADGRVVLGATVEEQGFDLKVTAGALNDLLRAAYELIPGITELEVAETIAGSRPATPDNAPLLGSTALRGLQVATGHFRNGILLAPITARAMVSMVTEGRPPDEVLPFSPARFSGERFPT
jgi:glycine oxidase